MVSIRVVMAVVAVAAASAGGWWVGGQQRATNPKARVLEALDGDTIVVELSDGSVDTVRILGVDTPNMAQHHLPTEARQRTSNARFGIATNGALPAVLCAVELG